jgi:hypothetical protein
LVCTLFPFAATLSHPLGAAMLWSQEGVGGDEMRLGCWQAMDVDWMDVLGEGAEQGFLYSWCGG